MGVILEGQKLRKEFGGLVAVTDVSLKVEEGAVHSIIGPNGAGKTTLFNMLSGKYLPTSGRVLYKGIDVTQEAPHERVRRGMGRSFQITNIFPNLSVLENVRLAVQVSEGTGDVWRHFLRAKDSFADQIERSRSILKTVRLDAEVNTVANALPHGGKRKLEFAILLATNSDLLLLDEPTAGMASEQVPELMAIIESVRERDGKTILLVEHNMSVVMGVSDRITVMNYGSVIAEGTPNEISNNETVQNVYLGGLYDNLSAAQGAHG
jgi:branched-chain amino acid transport system ATP-binding protein